MRIVRKGHNKNIHNRKQKSHTNNTSVTQFIIIIIIIIIIIMIIFSCQTSAVKYLKHASGVVKRYNPVFPVG